MAYPVDYIILNYNLKTEIEKLSHHAYTLPLDVANDLRFKVCSLYTALAGGRSSMVENVVWAV